MKHKGYNELRFWEQSVFPFEFHLVDNRHPRFNMPYHWHIECEIIRVLHGSVALSLDDRSITARPGDIVFIHDGVVHGGSPSDINCSYECIIFDLRTFLKNNVSWCKDVSSILTHHIVINHCIAAGFADVHSTVWKLFDCITARKPGYEFTAPGLLYQFFGQVIEHSLYTPASEYNSSSELKHMRQLKNTFIYIEENYAATNISLQQLADTTGFSAKYFCKIFKKFTRSTPIDYLNFYRVERACQKLLARQLSVTEIAYECGFNDLSYFIRTFKKHKNVTPNKYLQSLGFQN